MLHNLAEAKCRMRQNHLLDRQMTLTFNKSGDLRHGGRASLRLSDSRCRCWTPTCVLWHGGLVGVPLLLEDDVAELQHRRDHLQHAWRGIR